MHEEAEVTASGDQMIYFFGADGAEGDPTRKDILGGKGASLGAMCSAGLPVPPGFTLTIQCCSHYHAHGGRWPEGLEGQVRKYLSRLEETTGKRFGEGHTPLLVSVRSGAAQSMPGMMDTILNCGLHPGLAMEVADKDQFWSVYVAFIKQFANTVADIPVAKFDEVAESVGEPSANGEALAQAFITLYEQESGNTFPLTPWETLRECINAVFDSWNNERANVYRKSHGHEHLEGTAVNVQSMFNSQVSGIGFTENPSNPKAGEIIIESAYGLGESIVSGNVAPDRYVLDRDTLEIKEKALGRKDHVMAGLGSSAAKATSFDPEASSLTDPQILEVARIALKVEEYFGFAVDIEWGLEDGRFSLLQSRAIRGLDVARDAEVGREQEIRRLRQLMASSGSKEKVWVVHNLAETLETPTPLTWDITRAYMSGDGGYGLMYKDFGYLPSDHYCQEGSLELICGRIYSDVDRAGELFWESMPLRYDHKEVLEDPRLLEAAPAKFDADRADEKFLLRLPKTLWAMMCSSRTMKKARRDAIRLFEKDVLPPYLAYVKEKGQQDLSALTAPDLVDELRDRIRRVMNDFGKESLKPGFFGGSARAELEGTLVQLMGDLEGKKLTQVLTSGLEGDTTVEQNAMLFRVGQGSATMEAFLDAYGHRGVGEMEFAKLRYREDQAFLDQILATGNYSEEFSPDALHKRNAEKREAATTELPEVLKTWGGGFMEKDVTNLAREAQALLPYREIGKHYLLMGYELIRAALVELGRRWNLGRDLFFLRLEDLSHFESDAESLKGELARRKVRWQSSQRLDLPDVIDSRELDALGLPRKIEAAKEMDALSLSAGVVTGTARIVFNPNEATDLPEDCILVCPSTDPSWTALFTRIKGLIVERGGVLSHGAITARDFSIPAVACSDTTQIIDDGAHVRVDGDRGHITIIEDDHDA
jgi:rifampicin phosphotransferase